MDAVRPGDDALYDGDEPLEDVPADGCDGSPLLSELRPGGRDGKPHESQYRAFDELDEQFVSETIRMGMSEVDGLPTPMDDSTQLALAPSFTVDNVLCLEDKSSYVEVFEEDLRPEEREFIERMNAPRKRTLQRMGAAAATIVTWQAVLLLMHLSLSVALAMLVTVVFCAGALYHASRRPRIVGARSKYDCDFPITVKSFMAVQIESAGPLVSDVGLVIDTLALDDRRGLERMYRVVMRPKRERCKFYMRQMFANDDQPDPNQPGHKIIFRNCTKRRSVGGAFMSVANEAVYGCDYREPFYRGQSTRIDAADETILRAAANRELVPLFNLTAHLPEKKAGGIDPIEPKE